MSITLGHNWFLKSFYELTHDELYDILALRTDVFVVEQNCPYPELDYKDIGALHLFLREPDAGCPGSIGVDDCISPIYDVGFNSDPGVGDIIAYLRMLFYTSLL